MTAVRNLLTHPVAWASYALAVLSQVHPFAEAIAWAIWAQAPNILTGATIASGTIAEDVAWLPKDALETVALLAGVLVVAKMGLKVGGAIRARIDGRGS